MIMADIFRILFLILGTLIVLVSYWLLSEALFPRMVERARDQYTGHPIKTVIVGLAVAAPLVIVGIGLLKAANPALKFFGAVDLLMLVLIGLLGSAGLTRHIGARLASPSDTLQPWRRVLRGGIVLSLTFVLPLIGWFLVLPVTLVSGFGAAVLSRFGRSKNIEPPSSHPDPEAAAA